MPDIDCQKGSLMSFPDEKTRDVVRGSARPAHRPVSFGNTGFLASWAGFSTDALARSKSGEGGRTRTFDLRLKRPLLYQLSYTPSGVSPP